MASNRITILHDSFGKRPELRKDWGFAALLEFGGNTEALGVDLQKLDCLTTHCSRRVKRTAECGRWMAWRQGKMKSSDIASLKMWLGEELKRKLAACALSARRSDCRLQPGGVAGRN